jgi:chromosome segregation protein
MYLSKLEIFGFKSFAQKAVIKFDEGLTSIIGPNGCGKSNIVDAIRWVLGEQRPTILRCDRMENLIFNGSTSRKPLSISEVSMHIENNRQILPSDYTEVKITRRLFRSGESEYLINGQTVRLMDIVNLFTDTGMGADAYSVIELKMVEQILSENAEERRRLFEEAAGIKKYKQRRKSALRKLETTRQELVRLDDIISEIKKTVNSLARQVGKARRYHAYKNNLKEKDLLLTLLKLRAYDGDLKPLKMEFNQLTKTKDILTAEVHSKEAKLEEMHAQAVDLEHSYREVATRLKEADEKILEQQKNQQLRLQRIESFRERVNSDRHEVELQQQKIKEMMVEKDLLLDEVQKIRTSLLEKEEAHRKSIKHQMQIEAQYRFAREEYQNFIQENIVTIQGSNSTKEEYQTIKIEKENTEARLQTNLDRLGKIKTSIDEKQVQYKSFKEEFDRVSEGTKKDRNSIVEMEKQIKYSKEWQDSIRSQSSQIEGQLEKSRSRKDFLKRLIENYEGFSESVQYVMSHKSDYKGLVDTLANLVDIKDEFRLALESYLAEISTFLIVEEVNTARDILYHVREQGKGRLNLIPLPLINSNYRLHNSILPAGNSQITSLKELINYDTTYEDLFCFLFDRVFLVENLDDALKLRNDYPDLTFVTKDGDILRDWGNLTGGMQNSRIGLIGRKNQFESTAEELDGLELKHKGLEEELSRTNKNLEHKIEQLLHKQEALKKWEMDLNTIRGEVNKRSYEISHLTETLQNIETEITTLQEKQKQLCQREKELNPLIREMDEKIKTYYSLELEMREVQTGQENQLKLITDATQKLQFEFLNLNSLEKEKQQKLNFIEQNNRESQNFIQQREMNIQNLDEEIQKLQKINQESDVELESTFQKRDVIEKDKNGLEQQLNDMQSNIQTNEIELKKKQRLWNEARERLQQLELQIKELQVKKESVIEHLQEKYGDVVSEIDPDELDSGLTIEQVQAEIDKLRQKLEGLGDVNPLAIKEHEKEKERQEFLQSQSEDLISAEDQLMETIHKLNSTARKAFMETFEKIRKNFQKVFNDFFETGEADLVLVESRDPLEANIDISIDLKGKHLNTLSLLSAGEKTLTAISMLFAIYLVKPSPFCILDEVDAPLDDVNITRYTNALKRFSKDTQFILVTHNKRTIEATESLYGITMEESGVSKVVSVRLD